MTTSRATRSRRVVVRLADAAAVRAAYETGLRHGGYFLAGRPELQPGDACELVLVHPRTRSRLVLRTEVVWGGGGDGRTGVGLQVLGFGPELAETVRRFVENGRGDRCESSSNPHERLRGLSLAEQLRRARTADMQDRVALERAYGRAVWEALLQNPRISPVEVARIARKGTLPLPLLELIVGNEGWLCVGEVRRALLTNPRLRGQVLERVLRSLPQAELKLVEQQTAYPHAVREAARRRCR